MLSFFRFFNQNRLVILLGLCVFCTQVGLVKSNPDESFKHKDYYQVYIVKYGDTLMKISRYFRTSIDIIAHLNDLDTRDILTIGEVLYIPRSVIMVHYVSSTDTLQKIVDFYSSDYHQVIASDILKLNKIYTPSDIQEGINLLIPVKVKDIKEINLNFKRKFIANSLNSAEDSVEDDQADSEEGEFEFSEEDNKYLPKRVWRSRSLSLEQSERIGGYFSRPLRGGKLTSMVGYRYHPVLQRMKYHAGLDISAPYGTPVYASARGRVVFRGWGGSYGNLVIIEHKDGYTTWYGHLSKIFVQSGSTIRKESIIGRVGSTGISTGPHLHFEIRKDYYPQKILNRFEGMTGKVGDYW